MSILNLISILISQVVMFHRDRTHVALNMWFSFFLIFLKWQNAVDLPAFSSWATSSVEMRKLFLTKTQTTSPTRNLANYCFVMRIAGAWTEWTSRITFVAAPTVFLFLLNRINHNTTTFLLSISNTYFHNANRNN